MIEVLYSDRALDQFERVIEFLRQLDPDAAGLAARTILEGIEVLSVQPYIGRRVRGAKRELVIAFGRTGYVALYRISRSRVEVLGIRHQREAGFRH